jgi:hypothetical protein
MKQQRISDKCQKCQRPIQDGHGRWMYTSNYAPNLIFEKCQGCGTFTQAEETTIDNTLRSRVSVIQSRAVGGCNCTHSR